MNGVAVPGMSGTLLCREKAKVTLAPSFLGMAYSILTCTVRILWHIIAMWLYIIGPLYGNLTISDAQNTHKHQHNLSSFLVFTDHT